MLNIEQLKNQIKDLLDTTNDAELLDLVFKLLLSESGDDGLDAGVLVSG